MLLFDLCFLFVSVSDYSSQVASSLKSWLPQQTRLHLESTELFQPSYPDLSSLLVVVLFVASTERLEFTGSGSENFIGGSRKAVSTVIINHHGRLIPSLHRYVSLNGSDFWFPTFPAKRIILDGHVYFSATFTVSSTSSPLYEDPQLQIFLLSLQRKSTSLGLCSSHLSKTDSNDGLPNVGISKKLWLQHGNVDARSLCLTSATASPSNLVKLNYSFAVVKVARSSLSGLTHPPCATIICAQQKSIMIFSPLSFSQLSKSVMDSKMETPSNESYVLVLQGLFYLFGAVDGASPPMSSKFRHQPVNPTSTFVSQILSIARGISMLEDCSLLGFQFIEKSNQTSSCRGHERSFSLFLLFVEVNPSIKIPLHERYLSLGWEVNEHRLFPNRLSSCVMVRLGPEDTTRLIPMRLEVLEYSTSQFIVTISKSENFEERSIFSLRLLACGIFENNFDTLSNLFKFVSLPLDCFALVFFKRTAHHISDVVFIHVID